MKAFLKIISVILLIGLGGAGGYLLTRYYVTPVWEQSLVEATYWSEVTHINDLTAAISKMKREDAPDTYDELSRSFCRSSANILIVREQMNDDYWNLELVDQMVQRIPIIIEENPDMKLFIHSLENSEGLIDSHRKDTYLDLFKTLEIDFAEQAAAPNRL